MSNATVEDVLRVAASQEGYEESGGPSGHDGNITKYWAELDPGLQGEPWCAAFQRWVDIHAKAPDLPVSDPYYCPNLVTYAKQHGLWNSSGHYKPGDMVFFDFTGAGLAEHIGRVVSDDSVNIHTIEGNTLPTDGGNQADGGGVYAKVRPHGSYVLGVLEYDKLLAHSTIGKHGMKHHAPRNPVKHNPFKKPDHPVKKGDKGEDVKFVQWAVGVPVDGVFGDQTEHGVKHFQQYHSKACGDERDGVAGIKTLDALAKITN